MENTAKTVKSIGMEKRIKPDFTQLHFRVETVKLLHEIVDHGLRPNHGVLKVPLNTLRVLLAQCAQRCTELNDPVLNRIMFDLSLYELPSPGSPEYGNLMKQIYSDEKKFLKNKTK